MNKSPCTKKRPCDQCGWKRTAEGHDPCISNLPGVLNACCGHGIEAGYVQFENGVTLRGVFTIERTDPDGTCHRLELGGDPEFKCCKGDGWHTFKLGGWYPSVPVQD
jgi:hypothetical protein